MAFSNGRCKYTEKQHQLTAGFLIHGRHARIFGQIFDQIFGQVFDHGFWPGFFEQKIQCTGLPGHRTTVLQYHRDRNIQFYSTTGTEKYSFTVPQEQKNTVLQFYWDREKIEENHVLKIPYD